MSETGNNGNGKTSIAFLLTVIGALAALAALGQQAIGNSNAERKSADDAMGESVRLNRDRISLLFDAREKDAYARGVTDNRLDQLQGLSVTNRDNIVSSFRELDSKLQREMALMVETINAGLKDLDARLQGEIAVSRQTREDQIGELRDRLNMLETQAAAVAGNRWTKQDQERFEDQLGVAKEVRP